MAHPTKACTAGSADGAVARAARSVARQLRAELGEEPATVLALASGPHAEHSEEIAAELHAQLPGTTAIVVVSANGLICAADAAGHRPLLTAMGLRFKAAAIAAGEDSGAPSQVGDALASAASGHRAQTCLVFGTPQQLQPDLVRAVRAGVEHCTVVGAGGRIAGRMAAVDSTGKVSVGASAALWLPAGVRATVGASAGVQAVTEQLVVDAVEDGFVLGLSGERPLDLLEDRLSRGHGRKLTLALLEPSAMLRDQLCVVRGISGADPRRRAIHLGNDVKPGDRIAFGQPDAALARGDMESMLRDTARQIAGAAPFACLLFDSVARGSRLYGVRQSDLAAVRQRLPAVPLLGLSSTVELVPFGDTTRRCTHFAEVLVLCSPS